MMAATTPHSRDNILPPDRGGFPVKPLPSDSGEALRFLRLIASPAEVRELRALHVSTPQYRQPHTVSGYFDYAHLEDMAKVARLKDGLLQRVSVFPISITVVNAAVVVAGRHGLRAADSLHLGTMLEVQRASILAGTNMLALIADKALREAAEAEQLQAVNPEAADALESLQIGG